MDLGQIVHLGNKEDLWIIIEIHKKTIKGIVKNKVFKWLSNKPNVMPKYKPYTRARMGTSTKANLKLLNSFQTKELERLKKLDFCELEGI